MRKEGRCPAASDATPASHQPPAQDTAHGPAPTILNSGEKKKKAEAKTYLVQTIVVDVNEGANWGTSVTWTAAVLEHESETPRGESGARLQTRRGRRKTYRSCTPCASPAGARLSSAKLLCKLGGAGNNVPGMGLLNPMMKSVYSYMPVN